MRRPEAVLQRHSSGAVSSPLDRAQARGAGERIRFGDLHRHRQRARALGKRRDRRRRPSAARGPSRWSAVRGLPCSASRNERARLGRAVAVMVGKAAPDRGIDPGAREGREEFLRIADAGEGEDLPAAQRCDRLGIGLERRRERPAGRARARLLDRRRAVADDQQRGSARRAAARAARATARPGSPGHCRRRAHRPRGSQGPWPATDSGSRRPSR